MIKKEKMENNTGPHIYLSVSCPPKGHADFRIVDGHFICNVCKKDFTSEAIEVELMLRQQLKMKSNG